MNHFIHIKEVYSYFLYKRENRGALAPRQTSIAVDWLFGSSVLARDHNIDNIHDSRDSQGDDRDSSHKGAVLPGCDPSKDDGVHPERNHHNGKDDCNPTQDFVALVLDRNGVNHHENKRNDDLDHVRNEVHNKVEDSSKNIRTDKAQDCQHACDNAD